MRKHNPVSYPVLFFTGSSLALYGSKRASHGDGRLWITPSIKLLLQPALAADYKHHQPNLKQDGSLELDSRYGCTQPFFEMESDDDYMPGPDVCGVSYDIAESYLTPSTVASVKIGDMCCWYLYVGLCCLSS